MTAATHSMVPQHIAPTRWLHLSLARGTARVDQGCLATMDYLRLRPGATAASMSSGSPLPQDGECSDASLVAAIAEARDTAAFQRLFARYAPRLKAHYLRTSRSEAEA